MLAENKLQSGSVKSVKNNTTVVKKKKSRKIKLKKKQIILSPDMLKEKNCDTSN